MTTDQFLAVTLEQTRWKRALRIHNAIQVAPNYQGSVPTNIGEHKSDDVEMTDGDEFVPFEDETPGVGEESYGDDEGEVYEDEDDDSDLGTEYNEFSPPDYPRYEEIRQYLLVNRGQGKLCLDTMMFLFPENTMLSHILRFRGLQISLDE
jgi:hypothetical protein